MTVKIPSQCERVLAALADGRPHTVPDIHRRAGTMRLNSRVAELRKRGHQIVCERVPGRKGPGAYRYTWIDAPKPLDGADSPSDEFTLSWEDVNPRDAENRYRVYRLRAGALLELVATCADVEAVGTAIVTCGQEGEFKGCTLGLLDTNGTADQTGKWVISPWDTL